MGGLGIHTIRVERTDEYNDLVEKQEEYREAGDYEKQEETFEEASAILPSSLESYYQNACALYEQEAYQDCISFIEYDMEQKRKDRPDAAKNGRYLLPGGGKPYGA